MPVTRAAFLAAVLLGCYDPEFNDDTRCGPVGECPSGKSCRDGRCLEGAGAADAATAVDARSDAIPERGVEIVVDKAIGATGIGSILDPAHSIDCGASCSQQRVEVGLGVVVMLVARPGAGSYFAGWSGACTGPARTCVATADHALAVTARFSRLDHNLVFVTRDTFRGDFGGLDAGDDHCATAAIDAGLDGTFVALLSAGQTHAIDRLRRPGSGDLPRGFIRMDGKPIADTLADLIVSHRIWYPVLYDQAGQAAGGNVWTGSTSVGQAATGLHCTAWTVATDRANVGLASGGAALLEAGTQMCNTRAALACVMVNKQTALSATPDPPNSADRVLYLSKASFVTRSDNVPSTRDAADALCDAERPGSRLTRALLANPGEPGANRLSASVRYVRPDGLFIGTGADLLAGALATGIWVHHDGTFASEVEVWSGASGIITSGSNQSTCTGWTSNVGTELAVIGVPSAHPTLWWGNGTRQTNCAQSLPVYCVEP